MANSIEEDKKKEKQLEALKGAIGILHNKVNLLESRNRSLDAIARRTQQELQHLKGQLASIINRGT